MKTDHESLSAVVDGELDKSETKVLQSIAVDDRSRATWARYHLIGDVLRDSLTDVAPAAFSERLRTDVEQEPTMLLPRAVERPWLKPVAGFAIAASVAAIAVLGIQQNNIAPGLGDATELVADSPASLPAPVAVTVTDQQIAKAQEPLNPVSGSIQTQEPLNPASGSIQTQRRLNGYLVKFNEQRSSLGVPGVNPYVRIVGFESE